MNKHEAARLHLLPMLSRYRLMSESVQHDEQCSSLHDRWRFRYDEQRSSLHAEGLGVSLHIMSGKYWKLLLIRDTKGAEKWMPTPLANVGTKAFD